MGGGQFADKEYQLPFFHLRQDFRKVKTVLTRKEEEMEVVISENDQLKYLTEQQARRIEELELLESQKIKDLFDIERRVLKGLRKDPFRDTDDVEDDLDEDELFEFWRMQDQDLQGLKVEFKTIKGFKNKGKLTINMKVLFDETVLEDDIYQEIDFNIDYFTFRQKKKIKKKVILNQTLQVAANLPKLLELFYRYDKNVFLLFSIHDGTKMFGWKFLKLGLEDEDEDKYLLNLGKHFVEWWKPPIDFELITRSFEFGSEPSAKNGTKPSNPLPEPVKKTSMQIVLELFDYTRDNLDQFFYREKKIEEEETPRNNTRNQTGSLTKSLIPETLSNNFHRTIRSEFSNEVESVLKRKLNNKALEAAFIPYLQDYAVKNKFQGTGIEIHIDQARFLPGNVSLAKMIVRIVDKDFNGNMGWIIFSVSKYLAT